MKNKNFCKWYPRESSNETVNVLLWLLSIQMWLKLKQFLHRTR